MSDRTDDLLHPSVAMLAKLASIAVHASEFMSADGHSADRHALESLLSDLQIQVWLDAMAEAQLAPRRRAKDRGDRA